MAKLVLKKLMASNKIQKPLNHAPLHPNSLTSLIPKIDKIALVLTPNTSEWATSLYHAVEAALPDNETFQSGPGAASFAGSDDGKGGHTTAGYNSARYIALKGEEHRVLFQYAKDQGAKQAKRVRIEFNPARLTPDGIMKLHSVLISLFDDGWGGFVKHASISRLDVAVDLPGVRMDDFLFIVPNGLTHQSWGTNGHIETLTFGKSPGNQTLVYNKKLEQLSKGKQWAGKTTVRVERRLRNTKLKISGLVEMPNPFAKLLMAVPMPIAPKELSEKQENDWRQFLDSASVRGPTAALALVPTTRRAIYRAYLDGQKQPWWDPHSFWKNWDKSLVALCV